MKSRNKQEKWEAKREVGVFRPVLAETLSSIQVKTIWMLEWAGVDLE